MNAEIRSTLSCSRPIQACKSAGTTHPRRNRPSTPGLPSLDSPKRLLGNNIECILYKKGTPHGQLSTLCNVLPDRSAGHRAGHHAGRARLRLTSFRSWAPRSSRSSRRPAIRPEAWFVAARAAPSLPTATGRKVSASTSVEAGGTRARFCKLLKTADALVHNLSPKAARKLEAHARGLRSRQSTTGLLSHSRLRRGASRRRSRFQPGGRSVHGCHGEANRINGRPSRLGPSYHDQFAGAYAVIGILASMLNSREKQHPGRAQSKSVCMKPDCTSPRAIS